MFITIKRVIIKIFLSTIIFMIASENIVFEAQFKIFLCHRKGMFCFRDTVFSFLYCKAFHQLQKLLCHDEH